MHNEEQKPKQSDIKTCIVLGADNPVQITEAMITHLKNSFGENTIILTEQEAKERGMRLPPASEPIKEPVSFTKVYEMKQIERPQAYVVPREHENQPWYNKFNKKRGRK